MGLVLLWWTSLLPRLNRTALVGLIDGDHSGSIFPNSRLVSLCIAAVGCSLTSLSVEYQSHLKIPDYPLFPPQLNLLQDAWYLCRDWGTPHFWLENIAQQLWMVISCRWIRRGLNKCTAFSPIDSRRFTWQLLPPNDVLQLPISPPAAASHSALVTKQVVTSNRISFIPQP